jgi:hypothetical protein
MSFTKTNYFVKWKKYGEKENKNFKVQFITKEIYCGN